MKNKMKYLATVALLAGALLPSSAQTDTITSPGNRFKDPKATDDNSKVLIDTSKRMENLVDSLLDGNKVKDGKRTNYPASEATKPDKMTKQPADKTKIKKP
jgi:hypothetical protein